jgi:ribosomal protein S18 acetylase RimI-like enzyme
MAGVGAIKIRKATDRDISSVADLIVRSKRLNNEFDPLFTVVEDARRRTEKYVSDSLRSKGVLVLVATEGEKVIGMLRAEMRDRVFYKPTRGGHITDFYVLPEFRRKNLGNVVLEKASEQLRKMGAEMITAEVPTQNEIAVKFYTKRGFRSLLQVFAGRTQ